MTGDRAVLVEACVTSLEEARFAEAAGADRFELCRALETGGLSPESRVLASVLRACNVPVLPMVRLRPGAFVLARGEIDILAAEVARVVASGAAGVVVGVLTREGRVDATALARLVTAAAGRPVTFHRAFDEIEDVDEAMATLVAAGVTRLLTAGGSGDARDGAHTLRRLVDDAEGRITVMAGGRVRADHVVELVRGSGVPEVHARAEAVPDLVEALREGGLH